MKVNYFYLIAQRKSPEIIYTLRYKQIKHSLLWEMLVFSVSIYCTSNGSVCYQRNCTRITIPHYDYVMPLTIIYWHILKIWYKSVGNCVREERNEHSSLIGLQKNLFPNRQMQWSSIKKKRLIAQFMYSIPSISYNVLRNRFKLITRFYRYSILLMHYLY